MVYIFVAEAAAHDIQIQTPTVTSECKRGLIQILSRVTGSRQKDQNSNSEEPRDVMKREFDLHLKTKTAGEKTDPLDWWQKSHQMFPFLSNLVRKYLFTCH